MKGWIDLADIACAVGLGLVTWGTWALYREWAFIVAGGILLALALLRTTLAALKDWRHRGPAR